MFKGIEVYMMQEYWNEGVQVWNYEKMQSVIKKIASSKEVV